MGDYEDARDFSFKPILILFPVNYLFYWALIKTFKNFKIAPPFYIVNGHDSGALDLHSLHIYSVYSPHKKRTYAPLTISHPRPPHSPLWDSHQLHFN